jgi:nondiscriminating glutamyl-tRNA synthetase
MTDSQQRTVRTRFAPSPTGHLHLGGARTAIFNWLYARHHGGNFILRIEDTDLERSTRESESAVLDDLRWLGLEWDEGPGADGPHAPYRQSERLELYRKRADELVARGFAYRCFCSEAALEAARQRALKEAKDPHYALTCFSVPPAESEARVAQGETFVIRFHVPRDPDAPFDADVTIRDLIRGDVTWRKESLGDFILLRADGMPTYNFSVVVDDHEMEISHVIRAEEHLTNSHRQVLIYRAFGWAVPEFAHVSLILGEDRTKLSKRHGATSVAAFEEDGYLPWALANYLTLLGWTDPQEREKLSKEELIAAFDLDRITSSAAMFDIRKLTWLNGQYVHEMAGHDLAPLVAPRIRRRGWLREETEAAMEWLAELTDLVRKYCVTLEQFVTELEPLFDWTPDQVIAEAEQIEALRGSGSVLAVLQEDLEQHGNPSTPEQYTAMAERVRDASGVKGRTLFMPIRIAITGRAHGPELQRFVPLMQRATELEDLARVVGPLERVRALRQALEAL